MAFSPHDFDRLFEQSDDPWRFRSRWYEQRKRQLTLACLPHRRYRSGYEPGCANGELSAALATRCERLLVSDGSPRAVELARARLAACANVDVLCAWLPAQWPQRSFDLVVVSELGYFLAPQEMDQLVDRAAASLDADGVLLACHWRHPIEYGALDGDQVHERIARRIAWPRAGQWIEADFRIDLWCADPRSPAQREGLV